MSGKENPSYSVPEKESTKELILKKIRNSLDQLLISAGLGKLSKDNENLSDKTEIVDEGMKIKKAISYANNMLKTGTIDKYIQYLTEGFKQSDLLINIKNEEITSYLDFYDYLMTQNYLILHPNSRFVNDYPIFEVTSIYYVNPCDFKGIAYYLPNTIKKTKVVNIDTTRTNLTGIPGDADEVIINKKQLNIILQKYYNIAPQKWHKHLSLKKIEEIVVENELWHLHRSNDEEYLQFTHKDEIFNIDFQPAPDQIDEFMSDAPNIISNPHAILLIRLPSVVKNIILSKNGEVSFKNEENYEYKRDYKGYYYRDLFLYQKLVEIFSNRGVSLSEILSNYQNTSSKDKKNNNDFTKYIASFLEEEDISYIQQAYLEQSSKHLNNSTSE